MPSGETMPLRRSVGSAGPSRRRYNHPTCGCIFHQLVCSLEDAQVHVGLGNPPHRRLQSPITHLTDVVGAEHNWYLPPCRTTGTPTHLPTTDAFWYPDPAALPARACLPFRRSRSRSAPPQPSITVPVSVPVPVLPTLFLLRSVHLGMGTP